MHVFKGSLVLFIKLILSPVHEARHLLRLCMYNSRGQIPPCDLVGPCHVTFLLIHFDPFIESDDIFFEFIVTNL